MLVCDCFFSSLKISRLDELIETYLEDNDPDSTLDVGADTRKIKYCFIRVKVFLLNLDGSATGTQRYLKACTTQNVSEEVQ